MPRAFRLLEQQTPNSGGPDYPAQTRVRAIAHGSVRQGGTRAVRVRIDSAEGWVFLWPSQTRACPQGSIAQRAGDVAVATETRPAPAATAPAAPSPPPTVATPPPATPPASPPTPPLPESPPPSMIGTVVGPSWALPGRDELSHAMTRRVQQFVSGFITATDALRIEIPPDGRSTTIPVTLGPGFCYRVIVAVDGGVRTWEPALVDPVGRIIDADRAPDGYPVIGLNRPLCIPAGAPPITASIRVQAHAGTGMGALQVFVTSYNGSAVGGS